MDAETENIIRVTQGLADKRAFQEALNILDSAQGVLAMYQKGIVCLLAAKDISSSFIYKTYAPVPMKANLLHYLERANDIFLKVVSHLPAQSEEIRNLLYPVLWEQINKAESELATHKTRVYEEEEEWDADSHSFWVANITDLVADKIAEWAL